MRVSTNTPWYSIAGSIYVIHDRGMEYQARSISGGRLLRLTHFTYTLGRNYLLFRGKTDYQILKYLVSASSYIVFLHEEIIFQYFFSDSFNF